MSDESDDLPDDNETSAPATPLTAEQQLAASAAARQQAKKDGAAKARAGKQAKKHAESPSNAPAGKAVTTAAGKPGAQPPKARDISLPGPMVNLGKDKPSLTVQDPSHIGSGYDDEDFADEDSDGFSSGSEEGETTAAPVPRRKREERPTKGKRKYTPDQLAILKQIHAESSARVDIDDFLATKDKDQFHVPAHLIPDGFAVEWKNTTVNGKPIDQINGAYTSSIESAGWRPAPAELFKSQDGEPGLVPESYDLAFIEKGGSMLYIRPIEISEIIKQAEYEAAIGQVSDKMASLTQAPQKHNPRFVQKFSREYERRQPVMQDTKR